MRIAQLTLATADPAGQADFWRGRLGVPVQAADGATEVLLRRSKIRLEPVTAGTEARTTSRSTSLLRRLVGSASDKRS
jgi:hypothetical protein